MGKKEIFKFWDSYYEKCSKCGYSVGHAIKKDKDGSIIHGKCPICNTVMMEFSIKDKEYMYKRL